jgi:outer membrane murein-binding lipoprotein Lpp
MTENPLFTGDPHHDEIKAELREIRQRLDQLSADLATLSGQVQDLAVEVRRSTSS